jgi:hypothetical protein
VRRRGLLFTLMRRGRGSHSHLRTRKLSIKGRKLDREADYPKRTLFQLNY